MNWLKASDTVRIHNNSGRTISLIAFSRDYRVDPHSEFDVREDLAKNIPAGKVEEVKLKYYNLGDKVLESQIHMLFRSEKFSKKVKPLAGEKLFLYTNLAERTEWILNLSESPDPSLDGKRRVIGGPDGAADQAALGANAAQAALGANAAGPQDESPLERLREEVRQLTQQVEILQKRVADLETALKRR